MNSDQYEKARQFHDLHTGDGCFLMPNCWDVGSAKMLVEVSFKAIATTSAGVAFSLGHRDNVFCSQEARQAITESGLAFTLVGRSDAVNCDRAIHFHMLFLDGFYTQSDEGKLRFTVSVSGGCPWNTRGM